MSVYCGVTFIYSIHEANTDLQGNHVSKCFVNPAILLKTDGFWQEKTTRGVLMAAVSSVAFCGRHHGRL